jgi:hypothetical protein
LPAGERNDELADLLEWIANAKPDDERAIRAEIKRHYYEAGDKPGYEALNAALGDILEPGIDRHTRQEILKQIEPYAHTEPGRGHASELLSLASLLLLGVAPPLPAVATASAAWKLGWAARGLYFSELLGADLPPTFKVIDAFSKGVATSIKSIDLRAATYQSAVRLTYRLTQYVDKLVLFDGAKLGAWRVNAEAITGHVLSPTIRDRSREGACTGLRCRAHSDRILRGFHALRSRNLFAERHRLPANHGEDGRGVLPWRRTSCRGLRRKHGRSPAGTARSDRARQSSRPDIAA